MVDAVTYDGNMLFGHDCRHLSPPTVDIPAKGQWWPKYYKSRDLQDKRYYAHEVHVPDDYMIVDTETFCHSSVHEEVRMIRVNKRQVAIPMVWFFKLKDMTIYELWDFLRDYRLDLPFHLKSTPYLEDALGRACDMGMEADFLNMFYDMERDDLMEFERMKHLLGDKKKAVKAKMKACLGEINKLRATSDGSWTEMFDELYSNYSSGRLFGLMNFTEYCEMAAMSDEKYRAVVEETKKIHSVAWYISMITDDYISLDEKLQELEKQKEFNASLYSFGLL